MPYRILLMICLCLPLTACLRSKPLTTDARCTRQIDTAQSLYTRQAKNVDQRDAELAAHLITAAKIANQHQEFIDCLDKSSRAIALLREAASTNGDAH